MLDDPDEIDMSEADHVAWVRRKAITPSCSRDHYGCDDHVVLHGLLDQRTMDRSHAGRLFLWLRRDRAICAAMPTSQ